MMKAPAVICLSLTVALLAAACSTTRVLADGEYLLNKNTVVAKGGDKTFSAKDLAGYVSQKPNGSFLGLRPQVALYNLNGSFWKKMGTPPVVYDSTLVDASITNMLSRLEYIGYYGSRITGETSFHGKKANVTYNVELGRRYPISSIVYDLPERGEIAADFCRDTSRVSIRPGDYLSEETLEQETIRSASVLRNRGYYDFSRNNYFFVADTLSRPGFAALTYSVREYTRTESEEDAKPIRKFYIHDVSITREESLKFRNKLLTDLNGILPGHLYRETVVDNTYSRLTSIPAFNNVNIELTQVDTNLVDCRIDLTHAQLQGVKVDFEASVNSTGLIGLSPQLTYFHQNAFHGGERFNLGLMGNFQFKPKTSTRATELGVTASVLFPRLLGLPGRRFLGPSVPQTNLNASFSYQNRPEYTRNVLSFSLGYTGSIRNRYYYQVYPLQISRVYVPRLDDDFVNRIYNNPSFVNLFTSHIDVGFSGDITYTTSRSAVPKQNYHYIRLGVDTGGNLISLFNRWLPELNEYSTLHKFLGVRYTQFVKGEITMGKTVFFGKNDQQSLAVRLQGGVGYGYGNSDNIPFEKQFWAGGASSLRGWQARAVGPGTADMRNYFEIANQTGNMKLEANIEYRFPIVSIINGAVFVDAGNVWNIPREYEYDNGGVFHFNTLGQSIAVDYGIGIRADLSFILARIDAGFQLHNPIYTEDPWLLPIRKMFKEGLFAIHFGIGYPF